MRKNLLTLSFLLVLFVVPAFSQREKAVEAFKLGSEAAAAKNYDLAINHFGDCINAFPEGGAECYQSRAVALTIKSISQPTGAASRDEPFKLGGPEVKDPLRVRAIADVNKVLQLAPKSPSPYYLRAQIYLYEAMFEAAIADLRAGIALHPAPEAWKAELAETEKNYARRITRSVEDVLSKGMQLVSAGDKVKAAPLLREAEKAYTKALQFAKDDLHYRSFRAMIYQALENYPAAISDYTEVVRLDPADIQSLMSRAKTYALDGKTDLAIKDYERAMTLPTNTNRYYVLESMFSRGKLRLEAGRFDDAIADFSVVIAENREHFWATFYRGQAHLKNNKKELAIADFRLAHEIGGYLTPASKELEKLGVKP